MKTIKDAFSKFFGMESASSIVLIASAILAIFFANSGLSEYYFRLLETKVGFLAGGFTLEKTLLHWINDGLMSIFFFVIGLEIKRELLAGELRTWKKSALPVFAALGGMILPVAIFFAVSNGEKTAEGWGIPMATDIAFSLGILTLLGKRVPLSLKIFLTAFAIIDDLGAVLVIAIFYSQEIFWNYVLFALGIYAILLILSFTNVNAGYFYMLAGAVIWYLILKSGIHPTIAGVMVAFVIPVKRRMGKLTFTGEMRKVIDDFEATEKPGIFLNDNQLAAIDRAENLVEKLQPFLQHLENRLHGLVAYFIMPIFALANAGVQFISTQGAETGPLAFHIGISLLAGKVAGITGFSWLSVKLGLASFPEKTGILQILGISFLGAIGFTMALFINSLAFTTPAYANSARLGIIIASVIAGITGYLILRRSLKPVTG
jgi:NhaA family Na+:H+ antiporter